VHAVNGEQPEWLSKIIEAEKTYLVDVNIPIVARWREYAHQGLWVFPLPHGGKNPGDLGVRWKESWISRGRNPYPQLASAHADAAGLWLATGQISKRVVLDIDKPEAGDYWRGKIGEEIFDSSLRVVTGKGYHLHFRIPDDDERPWASHSDGGIGYDLRADGTGVVMPPSIHASGREYRWNDPESDLIDVPEALRHPTKSNVVSMDRAREKKKPGSTIAGLLAEPAQTGARNEWLTRVGGHLAKMWPGQMQDGYTELMRFIGTRLDEPMEEDEVDKTAASVWKTEKERAGELEFNDSSGQLAAVDGKLYTRVKEGDNVRLAEWADFDIRARRVVQEDEERVFYVDIETAHTTYTNEPLRAEVLGSINRLNVWTAAHHSSIVGHSGDLCKMSYGNRLLRYLLSQEPDASQTAHHYGAQEDGTFLTPDGLLEGGGVVPFRGTIPADHLSSWVGYNYGTCPVDEAVDVLREVLTFQDETVASVFGSWWAMSLLKGRYPASLFPFMLLEAGSESGKTTGFFAMMVALAGSKDGAGQHTPASFRDAVAAHRNGIAWLDDMTEMSTGNVIDMIRQATSEGTRGKKSADNKASERVTLISPILVSGEGSGSMMSEKAMSDRSVLLKFGSPKDRRSLRDTTRPQWDDVVSLSARYGGHTSGLTSVAGTLVAQILARTPMLVSLPTLRPDAGRVADKWAILRMGARVLDDLLGTVEHSERVDAWVSGQVDTGAANLAINEIIPWALRSAGGNIPTMAKGWVPAYYNERTGRIWVHTQQLADRWHDRHNLSARERQLGTVAAIEMELTAAGCGTGQPKVVEFRPKTDGGDLKKRYRELPENWTAHILERAGADFSE
jgi:Bifunctional DNA primase/polymerase, N-terminal/Primase C terminal 1 (PriCT-1)